MGSTPGGITLNSSGQRNQEGLPIPNTSAETISFDDELASDGDLYRFEYDLDQDADDRFFEVDFEPTAFEPPIIGVLFEAEVDSTVGTLLDVPGAGEFGNYLYRVDEPEFAELAPGDVITITVTGFGVFDDPRTGERDEIALDVDTVEIVFTCFAEGTKIATPDGAKLVEALSVGDLVVTADGRAVPIKFVGVQTVSTVFTPADRLLLVRVAAGALGPQMPANDLTLTADHALLVGGVLANAGALVNGETITRVPLRELGERYTVYHIETDTHDLILANGAPAETFIDNFSHRVFDNYAEYCARYGAAEPAMTELDVPRAQSARQLPAAVRDLLAERCRCVEADGPSSLGLLRAAG